MNVGGTPYRTIWLGDDGRTVEIIDQTRLPHEFVTVELHTLDDAVVATVPTTGEATPRVAESEAIERGLLADWDPDYLQKLGLG